MQRGHSERTLSPSAGAAATIACDDRRRARRRSRPRRQGTKPGFVTMDDDPYDLQRFVDAQRDVHARALAEIRAGRKDSHWMWFVFPQLAGLGYSLRAARYGISGIDEAHAYLAHPLLGPRLYECAAALEALPPHLSAHAIFGDPDDLKLRSCLTLFGRAAGRGSIFDRLIDRYFEGRGDERTLLMLAVGAAPRGEKRGD